MSSFAGRIPSGGISRESRRMRAPGDEATWSTPMGFSPPPDVAEGVGLEPTWAG